MSRKHHILSKTCIDLKNQLARGESLTYNFPMQKQYKLEFTTLESVPAATVTSEKEIQPPLEMIKSSVSVSSEPKHKVVQREEDFALPDYETDDDYVEMDDEEFSSAFGDEEFVPRSERVKRPAPAPRPRKRRVPAQGAKRGRRAKSSIVKHDPNGTDQQSCCVNGCNNSTTNRLRFSLRCKEISDFKPDFIEKGWDRVCNYCYFHALYQDKKRKQERSSPEDEGSSWSKSSKKRKRSSENSSNKRQKRNHDSFISNEVV